MQARPRDDATLAQLLEDCEPFTFRSVLIAASGGFKEDAAPAVDAHAYKAPPTAEQNLISSPVAGVAPRAAADSLVDAPAAQAFVTLLEQLLLKPVGVVSLGATHADKRLLPAWFGGGTQTQELVASCTSTM